MTFDLGKLASLGNAAKTAGAIPGPSVAGAIQSVSKMAGALGKMSSAGALQSLASTAKLVNELPPATTNPLVTASAAKAAYKTAVETAQAREDEVTATAYKQVFEAITSAADAGIGSITLTFNTQQQNEIIPLLQRSGYTVTVDSAPSSSRGNVEIKWS